ncbi:MAG: Peroxisomal membrane protein PAS20 [Vezdaea acicularis]|nr:MAG: Peroxisomal membrane protein PAS20 [Vezdaea acicularis]
MAQPSPPKPWERAGASANSALPTALTPPSTQLPSNTPPTATTTGISTSSTTDTPSLPQRPSSLSSIVNRTASAYSPYNNTASRFGSTPYAGAYGSAYTSPYSRFGGGIGGAGYGGYGGMGMGGYGGMAGGYGGMGGYGMGMGGMPGQMGMPPGAGDESLAASFSQSTQATFQLIESVVGAFSGVAQMLESTYMATHSSFFAMISVAEQFSALRTTLGSVLGIYTILRWLRTLLARLTGRPPPASPSSITASSFASFEGRAAPPATPGASTSPRPSRKPFLVFLLAVFGLPYLMGRLISALARSQSEAAAAAASSSLLPPSSSPNDTTMPDPTTLAFCRAKYDFAPSSTSQKLVQGVDLEVRKGDLVAVLSKLDPLTGGESEWWRCRSRDGRVGWLPGVWLEEVRGAGQLGAGQVGAGVGGTKRIEEGGRKEGVQDLLGGGRVHTLTSEVGAESVRAEPTKGAEGQSEGVKLPAANGQAGGDISAKAFQRSGFYD